jgi:competence ComEA-like helix-hairpin-helix protein
MKANYFRLLSLLLTLSVFTCTIPALATTSGQPATAPPAGDKISPATAGGAKVNINSADVETLCTLKGIGPSLALRIKEFREQHGPFKTPEDITLVRGVGQTILEWNKNLIDTK